LVGRVSLTRWSNLSVSFIHWILAGRSAAAWSWQTLITNGLRLAIGIATGVVTARTLGPAGRGELAAITLWPIELGYLATLGISSGFVFWARTEPSKTGQLLSATLIINVVQGSVIAALGALLVPKLLWQYDPAVIHQAQVLMIFALSATIGYTIIGALQLQMEFRIMNALAVIIVVGTLIGLVILRVAGALTPLSAALLTLSIALPLQAALLVRLLREYPLRLQGFWSASRHALSYGVRSFPIGLIDTIATTIDQAVIIAALGPVALGLYVVGLRASRLPETFQSAVGTVLATRSIGQQKGAIVSMTGKVLRLTLMAAGGTAIVLAILGHRLITALYGYGFSDTVPLFRILLLEVVIGIAAWILSQPFLALNRPGYVSMLQVVDLSVLGLLLVILIPTYGINGAAFALLVATTLRLGLILLSYPLVLRSRPPSLALSLDDFRWIREALQFRRAS
jgi:enterobacterial common antigen flippase